MRKIVNIAHRGFHRRFPENTVEAFEDAIRLGVDGIEFDVQETADGEFVVFHDDFVTGRNIGDLTSEEICKIQIGGRYFIPSLEEVLDVCGREMILLIELKQVRSINHIIELLRNNVDLRMVAIISFNRELIEILRNTAPDIMSAIIDDCLELADKATDGNCKPVLVSMKCSQLNADKIDEVHKRGGIIFVWGCSTEDSVYHALDFSIDGIISDYPDIVMSRVICGI